MWVNYINDSLFISDTPNDKGVPANKHVKVVQSGAKVNWHWKGDKSSSLDSASAKNSAMNPFARITDHGQTLTIILKQNLDPGTYQYDIWVYLNGNKHKFDPTLQIHH